MIVRLMGEGQYRVDDETAAILNDLDGQASQAVESGDEKTLSRLLAQMASVVRENGERLEDGDLSASEAIVPPEDLSLDEAKQLSAKVESFRTQKETIKAQYSAAEAQVKIGEASTGIGEQMADTGLAIQRAKDKTAQMQARAGAIDELTASGALEDFTSDQTELDRQLGELASQSQVDDELTKMKAEVGSGDQQKELQQ